MTRDRPEWSDARVAKLTHLWDANVTVGDIARQLGLTPNAVTGKVHRLGLTARASPLRHSDADDGRKARVESTPIEAAPEVTKAPAPRMACVGPTLPPLASIPGDAPLPAPAGTMPGSIAPVRQCTWMDGDRPPFRQCDVVVTPGTSWCPIHAARVFDRMTRADRSPFPRTW